MEQVLSIMLVQSFLQIFNSELNVLYRGEAIKSNDLYQKPRMIIYTPSTQLDT